MTDESANRIESLRHNLAVRRAFEFVSQAAILIWLVSFSLETLPNLSVTQRTILDAIEWSIALFFTAQNLTQVREDENKISPLSTEGNLPVD